MGVTGVAVVAHILVRVPEPHVYIEGLSLVRGILEEVPAPATNRPGFDRLIGVDMSHAIQPSTVERWLPVRRWEGIYEVSDHGRVRTVKTGNIRIGAPNRKYPTIILKKRPQVETVAVHRLVAHAFIGPRPEGMETRHLDGVHANNHVSNLKYGTKSENMLDRRAHGTARNFHTDQTHCKRGHELTEGNIYRSQGKRCCKTCIALRLQWKRDGLWDHATKTELTEAA